MVVKPSSKYVGQLLCCSAVDIKVKKKVKSLYLTSVVPSVTRLVLMEADGAPSTPPCLCQCSISQVFKAMATRIRGKSKQTLGH